MRRKPAWKSRKFWVCVVTLAAMLISHFSGHEIDTEELLSVILPVVAYILGEAWIDSKAAGKEG